MIGETKRTVLEPGEPQPRGPWHAVYEGRYDNFETWQQGWDALVEWSARTGTAVWVLRL